MIFRVLSPFSSFWWSIVTKRNLSPGGGRRREKVLLHKSFLGGFDSDCTSRCISRALTHDELRMQRCVGAWRRDDGCAGAEQPYKIKWQMCGEEISKKKIEFPSNIFRVSQRVLFTERHFHLKVFILGNRGFFVCVPWRGFLSFYFYSPPWVQRKGDRESKDSISWIIRLQGTDDHGDREDIQGRKPRAPEFLFIVSQLCLFNFHCFDGHGPSPKFRGFIL